LVVNPGNQSSLSTGFAGVVGFGVLEIGSNITILNMAIL
jgi:hypothetical protein